MRKNSRFMLKVLLALTLVGAFFIAVVTLGNNNKVYASEGTEIVDTLGEEETTATQEEVATTIQEEEEAVTLTEEEKGKLDKIVEWLSNLNKEELLEFLNTAKNWLVAGGIVTIISVLSAIIGLIAAIIKLNREKIRNSNLSEENKQKVLEMTANFEKKLIEGNTQIKTLLLNVINNMSDDEKKAVEANISDVRAKIESALNESNKNSNNE
jgi:predicted PurR-regulated permease PerM